MCQEKNWLWQSTFLGKNLLSLSRYRLTESVYCIFYNNKLAFIPNWNLSKSQCCMNSQQYKIIIMIILGTTFKYVTCIILYT